jgi:peroxiredoxin
VHEVAVAFGSVLAPAAAGATAASMAWVRWRLRRRAAPLALGHAAPGFAGLEGTDGRRHALGEFAAARVLLLLFTANRCPGVKAYDDRLRQLQRDHAGDGVVLVGINPLDERLFPTESVAEMRRAAEERGLRYLCLKDATQETAMRYGALCTPHVFLLDERRRLRYRGRIDDAFVASRVGRQDLLEALSDLLAGRAVRVPETAPLGCGIEWTRALPTSTSRGWVGAAADR